jgi:hypothetical protein
MTTDPTVPNPGVSDIHQGASSAEVCDALQHASAVVITACREHELRPTAVSVHGRFGVVHVLVTFPTDSPGDVDAIAEHFGLPKAAGPVSYLYERTGPTELGQGPASLTASTTRPGAKPPKLAAAAAEPTVITGELAAVPAALPAGGAR